MPSQKSAGVAGKAHQQGNGTIYRCGCVLAPKGDGARAMIDTDRFRQSAEHCDEIADDTSLDRRLRDFYRDIAARWRRLADEIDAEAAQQDHSRPVMQSVSK